MNFNTIIESTSPSMAQPIKRDATSYNKPTHAPRLKSCGSSGFAPLAFAHSASATFWLAYARQNVVGGRPIGAIYPSGRKYEKEEIRENVRGRAKKCRKLGLRSSLSMAPDGYTCTYHTARARRFEILWLLGPRSARIRSLHFGHILARLCSPKRRRPIPLAASFWPTIVCRHARASGRRAQFVNE